MFDFAPSKDVHVTTRSSKFFMWHELLYKYIYINYIFRMWSKIVCCSEFKSFCDLQCCRKKIFLQHYLNNIVNKRSFTCPIKNCTFTKNFQQISCFCIKYIGVNELCQLYCRFTLMTNMNQLYYS